jgi:hypothetical protein
LLRGFRDKNDTLAAKDRPIARWGIEADLLVVRYALGAKHFDQGRQGQMRIFVGGSLRDVPDTDTCRKFIVALGRAIVERGHVLLNGCRNPVDKDIAEGAAQWLVDNKRDPKAYVISYWQRDIQRAHTCGTVRASALPDWRMSHPELRVPEQIEKADVTIFLGGGEGTYLARNWAHWARKPILGVPCFGGAGEQIYLQELKRLRDADQVQSEQ